MDLLFLNIWIEHMLVSKHISIHFSKTKSEISNTNYLSIHSQNIIFLKK